MAMRLIVIVAPAIVELFNPLAAEAQHADKIARIGYLSLNVGAGDAGSGFREAFRQGLRDLGYVESRNLLIEYRDAEGKPERSARSRPSWSR
jgi:putative ABC transport system substrate-binding protein